MTVRYVDFRDEILKELRKNPTGLTWMELKERLNLPYKQPCPTWVKCLEKDIGLSRTKGTRHPFVWKVCPKR